MKQTYRLNWEVIQEFTLPRGHSCCSVDVNEALGEIMFACRQNGLLHYKWNSHSGLVQATKQPYRVTNYGRNCRLVSCCTDGSYLVLNHRQLRYFRLAHYRPGNNSMLHQQHHHQQQQQQSLQEQPQTAQQQDPEQQQQQQSHQPEDHHHYQQQAQTPHSLQPNQQKKSKPKALRPQKSDRDDSEPKLQQQLGKRHKPASRAASVCAAESLTAYSRTVSVDFVEYLDQAVCVGDARSMAADKQADCVMLLFSDKLACRSLSDLSESCVFDRCYSLTDELFNVRLSRQFLYLMNSAGDIMLRYRSECYEKGDQLLWRTIGSRAFGSPEIIEKLRNTNREICLNSENYLQLLDSESPVSFLGMACDPGRQMVFAATGEPHVYAVWHSELEPDLTDAGWPRNWLEDAQISLADLNYYPSSNDVDVEESQRNLRNQKSIRKPQQQQQPRSPQESTADSTVTTKDEKKIAPIAAKLGQNGEFIPGPMACSSGASASRGAHLYIVDASTGARVVVIRYTTETARIGPEEAKFKGGVGADLY